jgi:inner membrane transporter RhtA
VRVLPAAATVIGLVVLRQVPGYQDLIGIGLVTVGVAIHSDRDPRSEKAGP